MGNTDKFDMIANQYDTAERIHIAKLSSDAIRKFLDDAHYKSAIDFGCGTGLVGMNLLDEFGTMLFLDSSQNMIDVIKKKISDARINQADTHCFDLENTEKLDVSADYIFMVQVLLHIQDVESIVTKLYHALNSEGHLIIVDFNKNDQVASDMVHNGFQQEKLVELLSKVGYKNIQSKTFYSGSSIFMGKDASMFVLDAQK